LIKDEIFNKAVKMEDKFMQLIHDRSSEILKLEVQVSQLKVQLEAARKKLSFNTMGSSGQDKPHLKMLEECSILT